MEKLWTDLITSVKKAAAEGATKVVKKS